MHVQVLFTTTSFIVVAWNRCHYQLLNNVSLSLITELFDPNRTACADLYCCDHFAKFLKLLSPETKEGLIRCHPDLTGKLFELRRFSLNYSQAEQGSAGVRQKHKN